MPIWVFNNSFRFLAYRNIMDSSSSVYVILTVCAIYGMIVQVRKKNLFLTKCSFLSLVAVTLLVLFRQELSTRLNMNSEIPYQMISHHKIQKTVLLKVFSVFFLATMKGSLAATSISFIINFAVLGIWVSFMLNLGSDSVKRKYMIGFHISYSLMCKFFIVTFPQLL